MTDQLTEACGTMPGYYRHKRRGDAPCDPCREAVNAYVAEGQRKRRAAGRCPDCGYLRTAPGHVASCGGAS